MDPAMRILGESSPLYQGLPADSISRRASGRIPGIGTRSPMLASEFEFVPLIGLVAEALRAWVEGPIALQMDSALADVS